MALVNEHLLKLPNNHFLLNMEKKINTFKVTHPKAHLISLGTGDVTRPLPQASIDAMHKAIDEMVCIDSFHGYAPEQGYSFLTEAILKHDYAARGVSLEPGEIFINDGTKREVGDIGDLLRHDNSIGVTTPICPIYIVANVTYGRAGTPQPDGTWSNVVYLPCLPENNFIPQIPSQRIDIIYLSFPNNPTGAVITKNELKKWVNYAIANDTLIMYDAAYEAYIQDPDLPHSIYEIKGAKKVAIEFRSFSKTAGFTGVRCGYTVIPKELTAGTLAGQRISLNELWKRRIAARNNGVSYITQRAAEAIYSPEGKKQIKETIAYYMHNAQILKEGLSHAGLQIYGGEHAPYLWIRIPERTTAWKFFEQLLYEAQTIVTPGTGFGPEGENYIRLSTFAKYEECQEAVRRIRKCI